MHDSNEIYVVKFYSYHNRHAFEEHLKFLKTLARLVGSVSSVIAAHPHVLGSRSLHIEQLFGHSRK